MPCYFTDDFSYVAGDCAFIEAESIEQATEMLRRHLSHIGVLEDVKPVREWNVREVARPALIVKFKD